MDDEHKVYVKLKELPAFLDLNEKVSKIVKSSSWFDVYGCEWFYIIMSIISLPLACYYIIPHSYAGLVLGAVIIGWQYAFLGQRVGHLAIHGGLSESPAINKFMSYFCVNFFGSFSCEFAYDSHVAGHHPHTNIVGLGDSSIWKMPSLSCYMYMFIAPCFLPLLQPIYTVKELLGSWKRLAIFVVLMIPGSYLQLWFLTELAGFRSILVAYLYLMLARGVFGVPYIHMNIFQHIGLPMWDNEYRPPRVYQMSHGVLNLKSNLLLDLCFGYALATCHVEHHLFPKLSDRMCNKIKPAVRAFLLKSGLPHREETYLERLRLFLSKYDELMVKAPPITYFIGIQ